MKAKEFKKMRENMGFSQVSLAKEMGVSRFAIIHWEKGRNPIPAWAVKLIHYILQSLVGGASVERHGS